jgi:superoxide dismutase, Cu-Zn family
MWQIAIIAALLAGVTSGAEQRMGESKKATLRDSAGKEVGQVTLREDRGAIKIDVRVRGLPKGRHGIHLHETGLCDPPGFASAGPHYNPHGKQHGRRNPNGPHLGDLGNISVGGNGWGNKTITVRSEETRAGLQSFLGDKGRALIVHASPDDEKTDPSGNSGARIACAAVQ